MVSRAHAALASVAIAAALSGCGGGGASKPEAVAASSTATTTPSGPRSYACPTIEEVAAIVGTRPSNTAPIGDPMKGGGECHYPFGTDFGSFVSIGFGVHTGRRDLSEDQYESGLAGAKTGVAQPSPAPEHPATVRELTGIGERAYIVARNPPASDPRDRLLLTANSLVGDLVVRVSTKDPKGLFSTGTADLDGKTVKVLMATVKLVK